VSETTIALREADDLDYVEGLLARNGLPSGDVRSKPGCFYVGDAGDERVGIGGIERHGDGSVGLLRSLVVEETHRAAGVGTALCAALETRAAADGVDTLYLLTTTAAGFFAGRGYAGIEREDVPTPIRRTDEFDHLCPASATCMRKRLDR